MCDDRERLIGYVYDECDAAERLAIERHLASCPDCREEIRGLRRVRHDLLAWEVPAHEPIWRPMPAERRQPFWQAMPAWAMAAAAALMLMVGAAGGAATHALLPEATLAGGEMQQPAPPAAAPASLSSSDLLRLEQRVVAQIRAELDGQLRAASTRRASEPNVAQVNAAARDLARQVSLLSRRQDELDQRWLEIARQTIGIQNRQISLEQNDQSLARLVSYIGGSDVYPGGR